MALDTPKNLRNQVLYSVFVRQYSSEGTFEALRRDLDRIQALGADILWLMPIHPIGAQGRKGTVGSPYAIRDYRAVDPALGTGKQLSLALAEHGVLVKDTHGATLRFAPPLVISTDEIDWAVEQFAAVLKGARPAG